MERKFNKIVLYKSIKLIIYIVNNLIKKLIDKILS